MGFPFALQKALDGLSHSLRSHVERVSSLAQQIAEELGIDKGKASFAGLFHDIAREVPPENLLAEARQRHLPIHQVEEMLPLLLHGPVAAARLQEMGVKDTDILEAVRWHTTGTPGLGPVGRVVFIADKLTLEDEKANPNPKIMRLRSLARQNLDHALIEFLNQELIRLLQQGDPIHPASIEFRNSLIKKCRY